MTRTIRALIVDDEPPARSRLRTMLTSVPHAEVIGECGTAAEAAIVVAAVQPDAVFLDVEMPEADGFSLVRELNGDALPLFVFVTAHAQHAVRAFDVDAVDYLLKPYTSDRLAESVDRLRSRLKDAQPTRSAGSWLERIPVPAGGHVHLVNVGDVHFLRAERNYVRVHTGRTALLLRASLTSLAARLNPAEFLRVHRSVVVRIDHVTGLDVLGHGELALRLADGTTVISGRSYRDAVRAAFGLEA